MNFVPKFEPILLTKKQAEEEKKRSKNLGWPYSPAIYKIPSKKKKTRGRREVNPRQKFYGESLFERNRRTYGYHPKCKRCLTRKEGKCEDPQYRAMGVDDFYCADYREGK